MKKKKKRGFRWLLSMLVGFACALVLGALFYGTMVYQLAEGTGAAHSAPFAAQTRGAASFPGPVLVLPGEMTAETAHEAQYGGALCRVITREYEVDGRPVMAISASPAAYFERLSREGWTPQLVTGFTLAGLDAVCERLGDAGMLIARSGGLVYALQAEADDQALYALGAGAALE